MSQNKSIQGIEKRNQRLNGKKNAQSLKFMEYVRSASKSELVSQCFYAKDWERAAIERELKRRNQK